MEVHLVNGLGNGTAEFPRRYWIVLAHPDGSPMRTKLCYVLEVRSLLASVH